MKIILVILLIIAIFIGSKKLVCAPDYKVAEVSRPLAKAIMKHLDKHGVPKHLGDIKILPYKIEKCKQNIEEIKKHDYIDTYTIETCIFKHNKKQFFIKLERHKDNRAFHDNIYLYLQQNSTKVRHEFIYLYSKQSWDHTRYLRANVYKINKAGICNPKLFRILTTD